MDEVGFSEQEIREISQIYIVACGSAWHVGMAAQYVIEDLARIPVRVELASEFRYRKILFPSNALAIVISQSGETADSLAALREAKACGVENAGDCKRGWFPRSRGRRIMFFIRLQDRKSRSQPPRHTAPS